MRAISARLVGAKQCITMGDDCVETYVEGAFEAYEKLGISLKIYDKMVDEFEFCSRIYRENISWPLNSAKSLKVLLAHEFPEGIDGVLQQISLFMQFEDQYYTSPDWETLTQVLLRVGWYA